MAGIWLQRKLPDGFPYEKALNHLDPLPLNEEGTLPTPGSVRSFLLESGLGYEAKMVRWIKDGLLKTSDQHKSFLNDTKGIVMAFEKELNFLKSSINTYAEKANIIMQHLSNGVRQIDLQQLAFILSDTGEEYVTLQLPLQIQKEKTTVWVQFRPRGKTSHQEHEKRNIEILLMLELESFGKLRIITSLRSKAITCRIEAESQDTATFIEKYLSELKGGLKQRGYTIEALECVRKESLELPAPLAVKDILPSGRNMINVLI